jgi:hypothetical protein
MNKFRKFCITLLLGLILIGGLVEAQKSTGKIVGTVTDNQGQPLPGVNVEATSPKMVGKANALTDTSGIYRFLALPSGIYKITFTLQGFNTIVREAIVLSLEQTLTVNISMELGAEVTVIAEIPLIDVKSTVKGMTLGKENFERLPRGRNFDTLVSIIPGVNNEKYSGGISVDGSSGSENVYYVDGMNITSMYSGLGDQRAVFDFVDEVQIKASGYQAEFGGSLGGVINVVTRSGGNEYHGEIIGYYSGSMLTTKERDTLRLNPFDITKAEYVNYEDLYGKDKVHRYEIGFSLGGYIFKDRLWVFASFLPVFQNTERHVEWLPIGIAPGSDHIQDYIWWNGVAKITAQPIKGLRLSGSFVNNFSKYRGDLPERSGASGPLKDWEKYGFDYPNLSGSLGADYILGNNFIASLRGGYFHTNTTNQQVKASGPRYIFQKSDPGSQQTTNSMFPEIPPSLVKPLNWSNMGSQDLMTMKKQIRDRASVNFDLTYYTKLAGEHALKAGVQWVRFEEEVDNTAEYEEILLAWDTPFVLHATGEVFKGKYGHYTVRGGKYPYGTFANPKSQSWAAYLQDSWTPDFLGKKLTLNFGVRAEKEDVPSFSTLPEFQYPPIRWGFGDKIAPRIGFIFDVFGDSTTKIFGSYGLFYDVMKLNIARDYFGGFKKWNEFYTLDDWDFYKIGNGNYPGTYITTYNMRMPAFDLSDPSIKPMSQREISFGVEHRFIENISASIRVVQKHLRYAVEDIGVLTTEGEMYYIANPGYGYSLPISQGGRFEDKFPPCPKAKREYWGVNFNLDKRFSNNWLAGFSYTWSRLWGNYSGLASSDEWGRTSPNVDRFWDLWFMLFDKNMKEIEGVLGTDRPHQFKFYGSYSFDFGLTVGLVVNAMSGIPVSRELECEVDDGYYPDGRFTDGRTPFLSFANAYAEFNLKVTDKYRIQLNLNVDNIFDIKTARRKWPILNNEVIVVGDERRLAGWDYNDFKWTPNPMFLKGIDFFPPLEARIGVKIIF